MHITTQKAAILDVHDEPFSAPGPCDLRLGSPRTLRPSTWFGFRSSLRRSALAPCDFSLSRRLPRLPRPSASLLSPPPNLSSLSLSRTGKGGPWLGSRLRRRGGTGRPALTTPPTTLQHRVPLCHGARHGTHARGAVLQGHPRAQGPAALRLLEALAGHGDLQAPHRFRHRLEEGRG